MDSQPQNSDTDATVRKARIDEIWEQLKPKNNKISFHSVLKGTSETNDKKKPPKSTPEWMVSLGFAGRKSVNNAATDTKAEPLEKRDTIDEEGLKIAAAALAAVREAPTVITEGKIEVNEVRDFAGEQVTIKKYVDPNSKAAAQALKRKEEILASSSSNLDRLLQQIEKKPKLSVLDKSKKDWGEYKEEKGLEGELEAYKRSGDKYLDKVAFLQRADFREYEKERDARLALQAKRRTDAE